MPANIKDIFLGRLATEYGPLKKIGNSRSLFELEASHVRVYTRYSKTHGNQTFFGLRQADLRQLEGHKSFVCFLWNGQDDPLLIPFDEFEDLFREAKPASDGQIKAQVYLRQSGIELYIARLGRFKVENYCSWMPLQQAAMTGGDMTPPLTHRQIQSLLGSIGTAKRFDIWIPRHDRESLDWQLCAPFECVNRLPFSSERASLVLQEIDVIWIEPSSGRIASAYEVEHSTPVYSGLLRLNDAHLVFPNIESLAIVSNQSRRSVFTRHLRRPTFETSGLAEVCSFLEYSDVYNWHQRVVSARVG